ncbi:NAC domain-containing protein 101-like [Rosa rugosa]|uniref:NAC domain-containing protein 101-like n=1 Tax=Rosa rugosa TaxID=74645 RepID=UPI002B4078B1|nr:NAC domain-containing protein 101-like [Rosa rugosa]
MASGAYLVGYRFHPTDLELVAYYLHNRAAMVDQFRSSPIFDFPNFYGQNEPWLIWDMFCAQSNSTMKEEEEEPLYFFTHRKKLNPKAKKFDRKVGSGTWSAQYSKNVVAADDDSVIGIKREFRYEGGSDPHQNGAWLMQEYQITSHSNDLLQTVQVDGTNISIADCPNDTSYAYFDYEVEEFFGLTTDDIYDDDDCQFSSSEIQAFLACLD